MIGSESGAMPSDLPAADGAGSRRAMRPAVQ